MICSLKYQYYQALDELHLTRIRKEEAKFLDRVDFYFVNYFSLSKIIYLMKKAAVSRNLSFLSYFHLHILLFAIDNCGRNCSLFSSIYLAFFLLVIEPSTHILRTIEMIPESTALHSHVFQLDTFLLHYIYARGINENQYVQVQGSFLKTKSFASYLIFCSLPTAWNVGALVVSWH